MNSFQVDFLGMSLMNNTPIHFFLVLIMLGLFFWGTFFAKEETKENILKVMKAWFVVVFFSGVYIWTIVDFSIPLLIKSVAATFAFFIMLRLVKNPFNKRLWGILISDVSLGLFMALKYI